MCFAVVVALGKRVTQYPVRVRNIGEWGTWLQTKRRETRAMLDNAVRDELEDIIERSNILPDEREIIVLRFSRGWSVVKIAFHMNMSDKTVRRKIERAYDKMHKVIEGLQ